MRINYDPEKRRLLMWPETQPDFTEILRLPSRRWMRAARMFVVPLHRQNAVEVAKSLQDKWRADPRIIDAVRRVAFPEKPTRIFPKWYAFKTQPRAIQREAFNKLYGHDAMALYMEMASGKSKTWVDVCTARFYERAIDLVVIVAPLTVKLSTWMDPVKSQIIQHCPAPYVIHDFSDDRRIPATDGVNLLFVLVNIEALSQGSTFKELLTALAGRKFAIGVDEASRIKNHAAIRTKNMIQIGRMAVMRAIMTGTPVSKNLIDLYSQFEFLDPDIIGVGDYYAFRNRYAVMGGYKNKEIIGYSNVDELMGFIAPYIYECDKKKALPDLPPKVYMPNRQITLSKEHMQFYNEVKNALRTDITIKNVLEKALRLHQIVGGYVKNETGEMVEVVKPAQNAKLQEMLAVIDEVQGQVVIWARFLPEIRMIVNVLVDLGGVSIITGETPKPDRARIIQDFQTGKNRFFVGTASAGGLGIELTAASVTIYFSNTFTYEDRIQSEDRVHRDGIKTSVAYVDLVAQKTVDVGILRALAQKQDLADFVKGALRDHPGSQGLGLVLGL